MPISDLVTCENCSTEFPESEAYYSIESEEGNKTYWFCQACLDKSKKMKGGD